MRVVSHSSVDCGENKLTILIITFLKVFKRQAREVRGRVCEDLQNCAETQDLQPHGEAVQAASGEEVSRVPGVGQWSPS